MLFINISLISNLSINLENWAGKTSLKSQNVCFHVPSWSIRGVVLVLASLFIYHHPSPFPTKVSSVLSAKCSVCTNACKHVSICKCMDFCAS